MVNELSSKTRTLKLSTKIDQTNLIIYISQLSNSRVAVSMFLSLNRASSASSMTLFDPRRPLTTLAAHTKYSCTLCSVHPSGVCRIRSRRLYNLSASLTSLALGLAWGACLICSAFLCNFGRDFSSVSSLTIPAMFQKYFTNYTIS